MRFVVAVVALVTLAACQSGQDPALQAAAPTTTAPPPGQTVTTIPTGFGVSEISVPPGQKGLLKAVRAAHQQGVDRIVFEFEDRVPGYRVAYADQPITEDGSGKPVAVSGDSVLTVRMEPASGVDLSGPELRQVYKGENRIAPSTSVVTELVRTGDFEAVLNWAIGVKGRPGFRVDTLSSPPRLVVEVATP